MPDEHIRFTQGIIVAVTIGLAAWVAVGAALSAELKVTATVLPEPVTIDASWIAQSPDTHWPDHAVDVRVERVGDVALFTVTF